MIHLGLSLFLAISGHGIIQSPPDCSVTSGLLGGFISGTNLIEICSDNVKAFDALMNQGVKSVALTDTEINAWLAMQQPAEQMMQSEGQLSTAALARIKALVREFRQSQ